MPFQKFTIYLRFKCHSGSAISPIGTTAYTGFFLTGAPLKVSDYKANPIKKNSECQNLLTGWHLGFLGGHQLKKTPCM